MAKRVVIDIVAQFSDKASAQANSTAKSIEKVEKSAEKAKKGIEQLSKQNAKPKITVEDSKFTRAIQRAQSRCDKLGKTKASAILGVMDKASQKVDAVAAKAKAWGKSRFEGLLSIKDRNASEVLGKVLSKGREIAGKTWQAVVKVADYATSPLRTIKNMLFNLKTLAAGIFAGYATQQLVIDPVNTADSIESSRIAFENKLGSAQKAEEFLQSIYKFDEKSPFDTMQIVGIAQQMMNVGWEADNVLTDLGIIGDWAASMGKGEQGIQSVTRALGQMRQKGKLSAEEMLQLTEAGVSGWDYLAKYLGKTIPEVRELAEDGEIDVNTAIKGIIAGMQEFEGSAAATSDRTVSGIIDQVQSLFNTYVKLPWGEGLASGFKDGLGQIRDLLDDNKEKFKEWGQTLKEIGTEISTYLADKVQGALDAIKEVMDTEEFQNASAGEKIGILWDTLIVDPLSNWWNGEGRAAVQDKAVDIGMALGEGIIKGLGSFIANHPIAALLYGGYTGLKIAGSGSALGGIGTILGNIGSASAGAGILGFGAKTAIGLGAGNLAGGASLGAGALSLLGLGATAGGIAGGVSLISGAIDLYKGVKNDDKAKKVSGGWKLGGVGAGAAAGAALGSIIPGLGTAVGGLIGAGVGGVAGWIKGSKEADKYTTSVKEASSAVKVQTEEERKLMNSNLDKHFGDVTLSAEEMESTIKNLIGKKFYTETEAATKAISAMNESFAAFEEYNTGLKKNLWLTSIKGEAKLTNSEVSGLKSSVKSFSDSAKTYVSDAQYAATESITSIMGNSKSAKALIKSTNEYYGEQSDKLSSLSEKFNKKLSEALSDNVISVKEKESLDKIRSQMANIIRQLQEDEYEAEINILKAKYLGDLTSEGFGDLMQGAAEQATTLAESYWDEFGRASVGKSDEEIEKLRKGVLDKLSTLWSNTGDLGIGTLRETYKEELGILGQDLSTMLEKNTPQEIMSAVENMDGSTRDAIGKMMEYMKPTTEEVEKLVQSYKDAGLKVPEALTSYLETAEFYEALAKGPEAVEKYFQDKEIDIDAQFNINPKMDTESNLREIEKVFNTMEVTGNLDVAWTYDEFDDEWISPDGQYSFSTSALVEAGWTYNEFDKVWISPDGKYTFKTNADVDVDFDNNKFDGSKSNFGVNDIYRVNTTVSVTPTYKISGGLTSLGNVKMSYSSKQAQLFGAKFRGGIVGYSNGGVVQGGGQIIRVAEEGDPEMIIPLSLRRRDRAMELWEQTGKILHADFGGNYATGGIAGAGAGNSISINREAPVVDGGAVSGPSQITIDVGGIELNVKVEGGQDAVEAIQAQKEQLADEIAGIIAKAIEAQYQNMPAKKGA